MCTVHKFIYIYTEYRYTWGEFFFGAFQVGEISEVFQMEISGDSFWSWQPIFPVSSSFNFEGYINCLYKVSSFFWHMFLVVLDQRCLTITFVSFYFCSNYMLFLWPDADASKLSEPTATLDAGCRMENEGCLLLTEAWICLARLFWAFLVLPTKNKCLTFLVVFFFIMNSQ